GGPGNPFAREVAALRKALFGRLTPEKMEAIADKLIEMAAAGNIQAIKLLFSYTLGKPAAAVDPDQLDVQEWQHWKGTSKMMYDLRGMFKCMMPETLLEMVRLARPMVSADLTKTMGEALAHPETVMPPPMPDLVMGRSDEPSPRGADERAAHGVSGAGTLN